MVAAFAVLCGICGAGAVTDARDYAVLLSAETQTSPAQITLTWPQDTFAVPASYKVSRKEPATTIWTLLSVLPGTATSFVDTNVALNAEYEYQVEKTATGYVGYGYVLAGIESPLTEFRGAVVLIADSTYAADLAAELARLEQDLAGDGWQVLRHDVSRTDSPASVKALIIADYAANPSEVRSVFLFGHVPVPYSGDLAPDGHTPDHRGAWPADVYYGDMDGVWTDTAINDTAASDPRNDNVPQDGKFDQSYIPGAVELEVGRVDLANLPSFSLPERELLRQYLNKNHNFRHKRVTAQRRGMVSDNFGVSYGSAFAATGWRNFAACFGASNVTSSSWSGSLTNDSYLFAYGCGSGSYTSIAGVGSTSDFAQSDPQAVFTFLFGSYLGDWDSPDNVMRAALATPTYTLASAWAGRPHWFVHHMALGQTIGYSARRSQNNNSSGPYKQLNAGWQQVHVALMGDPTLRLHPVAPVTELTASVDAGQVSLAWIPSAEPALGHFVYRAADASGSFTRITSELLTGSSFTESGLEAGTYTYMVRAVVLEISASGSYYNASQGVFATTMVTSSPPMVSIKATDARASENGPDTGMYRILRTGARSMPLTVNLGISGTARNGADYLALPAQITIPAGEDSTGLLLIPKADPLIEKTETAVVTIRASATYGVGEESKATIRIQNARVENVSSRSWAELRPRYADTSPSPVPVRP